MTRLLFIFLLCLSCCSVLLGQGEVMRDLSIQRGMVYRTVDGVNLALDIFVPQNTTEPLPVILAMHGGSWVSGDRDELRPLVESLAAAGYAVVSIDYRLAPRWTFPAPVEDARAAVAWIHEHATEYHLDQQRLFVLGASAGGHLAALLGTQPETRGQFSGVMLLAAPTDFTVAPPSLRAKVAMQMFLGAERDARPELYTAASPISYVSADAPPFLIVHGIADEYVPVAQSTRMAEALRGKGVPVTLVMLPGIGNDLPSMTAPAGVTLLKAMYRFLAHPKTAAGEKAPVT